MIEPNSDEHILPKTAYAIYDTTNQQFVYHAGSSRENPVRHSGLTVMTSCLFHDLKQAQRKLDVLNNVKAKLIADIEQEIKDGPRPPRYDVNYYDNPDNYANWYKRQMDELVRRKAINLRIVQSAWSFV